MALPNTFAPDVKRSNKAHVAAYDKGSRIVVVGAGAFGGWASLYLLRAGFKVTLVDTWGPSNARASSGDETRVIRSTYGANETYFDLNVRALSLWKQNESLFNRRLFYNTGVLWFCYNQNNPLVDDSVPFAQRHQMEYQYLTASQLHVRYPAINTSDLHHAFFDPYGGYLKARESCQVVANAFVQEGGTFIQAEAQPGFEDTQLRELKLSNGTRIEGDVFVFACGAWLTKLFPRVFQNLLSCTRQEVYYFGVPTPYVQAFEKFPVWIDLDGEDYYYGIAGNAHRGFKIGVDKRGEAFNPTSDDHFLNAEVFAAARKFLTHRFPVLTNAPLLENRVCPYENSVDGNFILDSHPEISNIIFLGGGSGHGFKHGPAVGELLANCLTGKAMVPEVFQSLR